MYSYDDTPEDFELKDFSIARDREDVDSHGQCSPGKGVGTALVRFSLESSGLDENQWENG